MKITCEIVEDLLPLYADNVCSEQSRQAVTEHLQKCEKCKRLMERTQAVQVPHIEPDCPAADRAVQKGFRKIRLRWWMSILAVISMIPFVFLGWNEYHARGIGYTNWDELLLGNRFMRCLIDGDYAKAYGYLDIEEKKQEWQKEWFDEETLVNMESDGLAIFCKLGEQLEDLGGIDRWEYIGISRSGIEADGSKVYQIIYRIRFAGEDALIHLDVSNDGVEHFGSGGSFVDDPLAQFSIWSEYLWQDYAGCYYDPDLKEYVYPDAK